MNQIVKQVNRAQRRMFFADFVRTLCICLFVGLMIASVGLLIPKIWHLSFLDSIRQAEIWNWSWIGGGLVAGLSASILWSWLGAATSHQAAVEIDQRFKLKERLSSALALTPGELDSEAGQALVKDASDRAETIEVSEQFRLSPSRQMLLPILPMVILLTLVFVPNAVANEVAKAEPEKRNAEIKTAVEETRKEIKKKIEEMEARGLKDAAKNLESLEKKIDNLSSGLKDDDKKKALVELNNVKKQVEDRQRQLGGDSKELKKQLSQLKKLSDGPAKKISEAINDGDFKEAKDAIRDLVKNLKEGKLSAAEKKKLANDLKELAGEIEKMAEKHEQAKQELKDKIQKALEQGDMEKAARMQQKLEKMEQRDEQMKKMKKMAEKLQKCADCMKQGNGQPKKGDSNKKGGQQPGGQPSDAEMQKALEDLEDMMEEMDGELEELEDLEDIMKQIERSKSDCNGCDGNGPNENPKWQDWANGGGRGAGKRDKKETETGTYKSRVKGRLQKGETVVTGNADGNNISGRSVSEAREIVKSSVNEKSDPLENLKLPRAQREHAKEYFESLRNN